MEVILICIVFGIFLCLAFVIGANVGQAVGQNKTIEIPTLNPIKKIHEFKENKEQQKELDKFNTLLENIETYDGTSNGQKEV